MAPAMAPGDLLVVESWTYARRPPRRGELVLAADPRDGRREVIKRAYPAADGTFLLLGDATEASSDSRSFGAVPAEAIRWRAVARYWPLNRIGRIPPAAAPERSA